jgi:hypothetical protein
MLSVSDEHLPALYRVADRSSISAQRSYLRLVMLNLALIVIAALATSWAVSSPELRTLLAIIGAVTLVAGVGLTASVLQTKPDKQWFGARAVAESVKTISWRYMAGSEPYAKSLPDAQADNLFCQELEGILRERSAIGAVLGGPEASADQITQCMRDIRSSDLQSRKEIYLRDRIQNQRAWYGGKAAVNARSSTWWLAAVGGTQLLGAITAIALVRWPDFSFNMAAVLAAVAAAFLAWLQVKQHQELAHAYGLAAHELGLIEARAPHVATESEFSSFVADAENAISREHTMWIARRDAVP